MIPMEPKTQVPPVREQQHPSSRELQKKGLEMARYFKDFCEAHDLLFYFCGGCCIGAIRHKGFIPWDDDVDFFMPREDYEKLKVLWPREADTQRYTLVTQTETLVDHNLFITIRDNNTTAVKPYQKGIDMCHGLAMDILPLDGCPDSSWQRKKQLFWALLYSLFCAQLVPENHGKKVALLGKIALGLVPSRKLRYRIWKLAEKHMTRYPISQCSAVTELCSGPKYMRNRYPKEWFASSVYREFEGEKFPLPVGYDGYLRMVFGDYMQLPPEEQRQPSHDLLFCDLERGYQAYRGQWDCTADASQKKQN